MGLLIKVGFVWKAVSKCKKSLIYCKNATFYLKLIILFIYVLIFE